MTRGEAQSLSGTSGGGTGYYVVGGIVAGLIAGIVMAMLVMIVTAVSGMGLFAAPEMIGQTFMKGQTGPGVVILGLMGHMMNSAIFGVIWGLVWKGVAKGGWTSVVSGMVYGVLIWLVMTYGVARVLGSPIPGPLPGATWFIAHLMFGLVLGLWPVVQADTFAPAGARR